MAARQYIGRRGLAVGFGVTSSLLQVIAAVTAWNSPDLTTPRSLAYVADAALWAPWGAIGALIAARGIRTQGSTMLALAVTAWGFSKSVHAIPLVFDIGPAWLTALDLASAFIAAGAYLRASQLFPRPLTRNQVLSPRATLPQLRWTRRALAAMLWPWAAWLVAAVWVPIRYFLPDPLDSLASVILVMIGGALWRIHFRIGNPTVRKRVNWIVQTVIVFAVMYTVRATSMPLLRLGGVGPDVRSYLSVAYSAILAIAGCGSLAMAVFSAGAFNVDFVLRRTLAYGAIITFLLFGLNVILSFAVDSAVQALGISDRLIIATLATALGILFEPLVRSLETVLERLEPHEEEGEAS